MRPAALAGFLPLTEDIEGKLDYLYLDVKGLVSTGIGNLADPIELAYAMPWRDMNGELAERDAVSRAWHAVKARQDLSQRGGGAFRGLTDVHLDEDGLRTIVDRRRAQNEAILLERFPAFGSWPADAQLALHSIAWAVGPHFSFPHLEAAVSKAYPDFGTASVESHMSEVGNPGVAPRNVADAILFSNAQIVLDAGLDPARLYYPQALDPDNLPKSARSVAVAVAARTAPKPSGGGGGLASVVILGALGFAGYRVYLATRPAKAPAHEVSAPHAHVSTSHPA